MASSLKIMELSTQFRRFIHLEESTYIIYGSYEAIGLYEKSLDTLINSDCFEFDIREFTKGKRALDLLEGIFDIDSYYIIDEETFRQLHMNLCQKLKKFVIDPGREKWLKKSRTIQS